MEIKELKDIRKELITSRVTGIGTTAICFKLKDNNVFKCYLNTENKKRLFAHKNMLNFLSSLEQLENKTYHPPKEIVMKKDKVVGYIYPYIPAKTLHTSIGNIQLFDILRYYSRLLEDTKEVSKKNFILEDLHGRNILYNKTLNIIDLDQGKFKKLHYEDPYKKNMKYIMQTVMNEVFGVKEYEILNFININLDEMYKNMDWTNISDVYEFFKEIAEHTKKINPSIHRVRMKIGIRKEINDYYKSF